MSWMRGDVPLKIASVVLAVFLWMYLNSEAQTVQAFQVPLELADLPPGLSLVGDIPDSVLVRVRASDATFQNLSPGRFHARVRLSGARPGSLSVPLTEGIIRAPFGVEVLRIDPDHLELQVEERITREVPVVARIQGQPASGYESRGHTLSPSTATVEGPGSVVREVREVLTEVVDIEGARESIEKVVSLVPDRGGVRVVSDGVSRLELTIGELFVTRRFTGIRLEPAEADAGATAEFRPETIEVTLQGPKEALDAMSVDRIRAVLDLEGMAPRRASYTVRPRIILEGIGDDVSVHSVSEPTVDVRISR